MAVGAIEMFIQTEAMPDPMRMKFFPGEAVLASGVAEFPDEEAAERSPLAGRLFDVEGVDGVILYDEFLTVAREEGADWQMLKPLILGAIMDHYTSGDEAVLGLPGTPLDGATAEAEPEEYPFEDSEDDREIIDQVVELIKSRVQPAAEQMGGDVIYKGFKDGTVYVEFVGPTVALAGGMTNVLAHYIPDVKMVKDFHEAIAKPGLDTPHGRAVKQVLDERINPSVASHGGHIALIDVKADTAYIRLEGGCQGCGMADVTLKQGIEVEIKSAVPAILQVLDVTDHAGGTNPYYSQGK
jgi:Fe-S cluster biogenesis protein NfuA